MVQITVSNDNFATLLSAERNTMIVVSNKNMLGEVVLVKVHDTKPNVQKDGDCTCIECEEQDAFCRFIDKWMKQGYKVSSTDCSNGKYRAVMIKEA